MQYKPPWEKSSGQYHAEYAKLEASGTLEAESAVRIAVLGSHTLGYFSRVLAVRLYENGITANVWTAPYAQIERQISDPESELAAYKPNYSLFVLELQDALGADAAETWRKENHSALKEHALSYCRKLVERAKTCGGRILLSNFTAPATSVYGSRENALRGERRFVHELNHALADECARNGGAALVDLDAACANAGKLNVEDERFRLLGDVRLNFKQSVQLAEEVLGQLIALRGAGKKCIVLDLDNTLWGGVVGEDGLAGIRLGQNDAAGKAFREFQKELLRLHKRGVILALNSRNNEADALEAIRGHPEMVLREEHFAAIRANWQDKAANLEELAAELNIGLDSMVFIDDDAFNTGLVNERLPQVTTILLPRDPSGYALLVKTLKLFDSASVTDDDLKRGASYAQERRRKENEKSFGTYEDFLASLELKMTVSDADDYTIPRIAQLSQRTNQFNMTTRRYDETALKKMLSSGFSAYWMSVEDRFGDYGVVGACIIRDGSTAEIDSFFMSCRVLGKGIEGSFLWKVLDHARANGSERVTAEAIPTAKNKAFLDFYAKAGLHDEGGGRYSTELSEGNFNYPNHIIFEGRLK
ncbi:hypothetical protein AUJ14_03505 [Candidatus Micrarchaeota archaeon CG1_02_55_22]|nr:MAG: hypothetical protein AUJ14_03505 [Candidatus Micrarchaeota archaeon CG1_02_55_22]